MLSFQILSHDTSILDVAAACLTQHCNANDSIEQGLSKRPHLKIVRDIMWSHTKTDICFDHAKNLVIDVYAASFMAPTHSFSGASIWIIKRGCYSYTTDKTHGISSHCESMGTLCVILTSHEICDQSPHIDESDKPMAERYDSRFSMRSVRILSVICFNHINFTKIKRKLVQTFK